MGMVKRGIVKVNAGLDSLDNVTTPNYKTISANFYPVDSAIVMRDQSGQSQLQVTVMNDRPQGGSADLTQSANIELM